MGLYGNILVVPADPDYWPPADRDVLLTLDDLLVEDGKIAPFSPVETTLRGDGPVRQRAADRRRAGLLRSPPRAGEVVRLWLTNTANTRVFNVPLPGARMKLVGGDSGRVEHEEFVSEVILAPSERAVVDVLLDQPGQLDAGAPHPGPDLPAGHDHRRPASRATPSLAERVRGAAAARRSWPPSGERSTPGWPRRRTRSWPWSPRWTTSPPPRAGPVLYACPMHPEVTSDEPGRCPKCGMKLLATAAATTYACPMHPEVTSDEPGRCPKCGMKLLATAAAAYACPMHPEVTSDQPGRCPSAA